MDKKQLIKIAKITAIIYVASFLVINWNDVSWIFNYKEVSGLVSDFFNPYPSIDASSINNSYFYPNHSQNTGQAIAEIKTAYTEKQNTLEVPKLGIEVPIIFSQSTDKSLIMKDLDAGVVYYPGSVYPGQIGQIVILGHSAPVGWPKIKHDWVFSDLNNLNTGDIILIDINNKQYTYTVKQKAIIERGEDISADNPSANNSLVLISCWPPGKDYQRIIVQAELINN
jgi:LPXTG-site transpeptidase (sortase) family protein